MRYAIISFISIVCVVVAVGCSPPPPAPEAETGESTTTGAIEETNRLAAAESWSTGISGYRDWQLAPGTEPMHEDAGNPHGQFGSVYINQVASAAIMGNGETLPDGSILVRENFNEEQVLIKLTVMRKHAGAWFWAVYEPDGMVQAAGEIQSCAACHREASRDGVFFLSH